MIYDLVVIGGGPGGEKGAAAAAFFEKKVALVERSDHGPGGAAVHTGTLPSKTLRETALFLTGFRRRELYRGFTDFGPLTKRFSAAALMCRLPEVRAQQAKQISNNLARHKIDVIHGSGHFEGPNRFNAGGQILEARYFLIATGSKPRKPPCFDFSDPEVYDSDSLLEIDRIPESLAVIGGGVIGSEYACVFAALGVKIEVIEARPRLLEFLDYEISDALMASMREAGIALHLDTGVECLDRRGPDLELTLRDGSKKRVDKVLVSAGRTGNTEGLGLEAIGVKVDDRGLILADERYRTSLENVYAVGDVIGRPALASTSMEQGRVAVSSMFGLPTPKRDWKALPYGIYTIPEAAAIGPNEDEVRKSGVPYVIGRSYMRHNPRGQIIGDTDGLIKLIFNREDRRLIAAHIICERATELIHLPQAVIRLGGGIDYFLESVMTYPSLTEAFKYAAYDALGQLHEHVTRPPPLA